MDIYEHFSEKIEGIEEAVRAYEEAGKKKMALDKDRRDLSDLRKKLEDQFSRKYGVVKAVSNKQYSVTELAQIRAELLDTSFVTLVKRFFGIGRKSDEIYVDLMVKLNSVIHYLENAMGEQDQFMDTIEEKLSSMGAAYEKLYLETQSVSGCTADSDWGRFEQLEEVSGDLYLGDIDTLLDIPLNHAVTALKKHLPNTFVQSGATQGSIHTPFTYSLKKPFQLMFDYAETNSLQAIQSVRSLIYQMIRMTPNHYLEFHLFDAKSTGSHFLELVELQKVREADQIDLNRRVTKGNYRFSSVYSDNRAISEGLQKLSQFMMDAASEMGTYEELALYNEANQEASGKGIIPYQVVLVDNFPTGFSEDDIQKLDRLITNGGKRGVFVILMSNRDEWQELNRKNGSREEVTVFDKLTADAQRTMALLTLEKTAASILVNHYQTAFRLQLMRSERNEYIQNVIAVKNKTIDTDNYFPHVIDTEMPYGRMDATKGLHIPFAIDRRGQIMEYCLGEAMNAHGLICGGTGSGKSTLLHMLVSSIVMNYSPDDVEIWLTDYKITEFYSYKNNTPPHVRFVGLSKTSDFSYAFIDKISNEMTRRQDAIAEANIQLKLAGENTSVTNFVDYRQKFGIHSMRRLLVIIDEFHVMAQHAQQEAEYKEKLENLLAEARALGIILVFSDQAIVDGLRGLSDKGKKQIKARLALSNYEDELKETLGEKEREKIKPFLNMKVGDVAMQTVTEERDEDGALKEVTSIVRGKTIYIDGTWRAKVSAKARELYHAEQYEPDSFDERVVKAVDWNAIQKWEDECLPSHRHGGKDMQIYLGCPVNLDFSLHFSLLQRKGNNIMSIGGSEEQQMQILQAIVGSFVRQENYRIVVMTDPYASLYREFGVEIQDLVRDTPHMELYEELSDICYQTNGLLGMANDRGNQTKTLVIWLGLDVIADLLVDEPERKPQKLVELASGWADNPIKAVKAAEKEKPKMNAQDDLEKSFDALFASFGMGGSAAAWDEDEDPYAETAEDADPYAEEEQQEESLSFASEYLYNARDDIEKILHIGPTRNIYNLVFYDTSAALKDFRGAKTSDFGHKIAFAMSDNDASDFLDRSNLIRTLPATMAFYYDGRAGKKFIPYKL